MNREWSTIKSGTKEEEEKADVIPAFGDKKEKKENEIYQPNRSPAKSYKERPAIPKMDTE